MGISTAMKNLFAYWRMTRKGSVLKVVLLTDKALSGRADGSRDSGQMNTRYTSVTPRSDMLR